MLSIVLTLETNFIFVGLITTLIILSTWFFYKLIRTNISKKSWMGLVSLRISAILVLLILIFKPTLSFRKALPPKSTILLIDTSRSMGVKDLDGLSRLDYISKTIIENMDIIKKLPQSKIFSFDEVLSQISLNNIGKLQPKGQTTNIRKALKELSSKIDVGKIQNILLISDGNHLGEDSPIDFIKNTLTCKIYAIGVGKDNTQGKPNITLTLSAPLTKLITNADNIFALNISFKNMKPNTTSELKSYLNNKLVHQQTIKFSTANGTIKVNIPIKPPEAGKVKLRFEISPVQEELTPLDNKCLWSAITFTEKIKLLILEGCVRPEFKFLKQLIKSDPAIEFASFIQIRPSKFLVSVSSDEIKTKTLPKTREEFEIFDAFIFGDISHRTLTSEQIKLLDKEIRDGKGLFVIAGENLSKWRMAELKKFLPAKIDKKLTWQDISFIPKLTLQGKADPIFEGLITLFTPKTVLKGIFTPVEISPADIVLMQAPQDAPVLIKKNYGKGKVYLLLSPETWRWFLNPNKTLQNLYTKFWSQVIRSLTPKRPGKLDNEQIIVNTIPTTTIVGTPITIRGSIFDKTAKPILPENINCTIELPDKTTIDLEPNIHKDSFDLEFTPKQTGKYIINIATKSETSQFKETIKSFAYQLDNELTQVALNRNLLNKIAQVGKTEGLKSIDDLPFILQNILSEYTESASKQTQQTEIRTFDYRIYLMFLFIGFVTTEWFLRYRLGLK